MKSFLKISALLLLLINGTGAIFAGWNFITNPDGSGLQMSLSDLEHSPFTDYFIPGIILFNANGLFSIFVFAVTIFNMKNYSWFIIAQGAILTGWIVIQVIMLQTFHYLHFTFGAIGVILIFIGWRLVKSNTLEEQNKKMS